MTDTPSAKAYFIRGKELLKQNDLTGAFDAFSHAHAADKERPDYLSYYGMTAALRHGKVGLGLELCTRAIKQDFSSTELYLNLAKVYLAAGNKKGAITALTKGLKFDPDSKIINDMLVDMGVRKKPIIPFLKRSNPLNRALGIFFRRTLPQMLAKRPGARRKDQGSS